MQRLLKLGDMSRLSLDVGQLSALTGNLVAPEEAPMTRKMIDCRTVPSENNCSLAIAGTEDEVLDAAVAHAVSAHGHEDSPELRDMLRGGLQDAEGVLA
jgi:predicted small metal-binding protein